jgi:hypothetical protein
VLADLEVVHDLGAKLDALGIPWVVVGSVASSLLGEPRATADVDLVADLRGVHIREFCRSIEEDYYVNEETARWAASERRSFNVIHQATVQKVDIFCCKADPLSRAQLQRRTFQQIAGRSTPFLAPEDAILQKLHWFQELGTSEQQWRDALGVLRVRWDVLDREYLHAQARDNGLDELLRKLIVEREPF